MEARMQLAERVTQLAPNGHPNFREIKNLTPVRYLINAGNQREVSKVLFRLVKDFCASINVVRNMNELQMIDSVQMLMDECSDFRIEDYLMMFTLAKRGKLVKVYDRLDASIISQIVEEYDAIRFDAGRKIQTEDEIAKRQELMQKQLDGEKRGEKKDYLPELTKAVVDMVDKFKSDEAANREDEKKEALRRLQMKIRLMDANGYTAEEIEKRKQQKRQEDESTNL